MTIHPTVVKTFHYRSDCHPKTTLLERLKKTHTFSCQKSKWSMCSITVWIFSDEVFKFSPSAYLRRSQTLTEFPAAAYRTVPLGLRAIWLIWFSPAGMVTVRLVLDAQTSPTVTWPEDLEPHGGHMYESAEAFLRSPRRYGCRCDFQIYVTLVQICYLWSCQVT